MKGISCPKDPGHNIQLLQFDQIQRKHLWTYLTNLVLPYQFGFFSKFSNVKVLRVLKVNVKILQLHQITLLNNFWENRL